MRRQLAWAVARTLFITVGVSGLSLSNVISGISDLVPLTISTTNSAQEFEGWGTSLAWFAEYVGCLEGTCPVKHLQV